MKSYGSEGSIYFPPTVCEKVRNYVSSAAHWPTDKLPNVLLHQSGAAVAVFLLILSRCPFSFFVWGPGWGFGVVVGFRPVFGVVVGFLVVCFPALASLSFFVLGLLSPPGI